MQNVISTISAIMIFRKTRSSSFPFRCACCYDNLNIPTFFAAIASVRVLSLFSPPPPPLLPLPQKLFVFLLPFEI